MSSQNDPSKLIACHEDVILFLNQKDQRANEELCLITGRKAVVAKVHGATPIAGSKSNAKLISFQVASGYNSYGKEQGGNAPISEVAAEGINKAFNMLSRSERSSYRVGESTILFWTSVKLDPDFLEAYKTLTFEGVKGEVEPEEELELEDLDKPSKRRRRNKDSKDSMPKQDAYKMLRALKAAKGQKGAYIDLLSKNRFYVLSLAPNSARISVKMWVEGAIPEIVGNTLEHLQDMNIVSWNGECNEEYPPIRSLYGIVKSLSISSKSDEWPSLLISGMLQSIVKGLPYPKLVQQACLRRIRAEHKVTELRAALLKAYINRMNNKQINKLNMALDNDNGDLAYLAGRLFAVLDQIQSAANKNVKATILDRYYGAASATPASVFGRLIQLSNHHLSKIRQDRPLLARYFQDRLGEIFGLIPGKGASFPAHFTLDQQSVFAVGYYHQRASMRKKNESKEDQSNE